MADIFEIAGRINSTSRERVVTTADQILAEEQSGIKQSDVNAQHDAAIADRYTKEETYNKSELNNMITTPDVEYITVQTYQELLAITDHPEGAIYRVANYDGTQVVTNKYAEYSYNGTGYVLLAVRDHGIASAIDFDNPTSAQRDLLPTIGALLDGMDATPTAGSVKPVQSGGVLKDSCILVEVPKGSEDKEEINEYINASNKWAGGSSVLVSVDPLTEDCVYVKANSNNGFGCAFLTSDQYITDGQTVSTFAGGATERTYISVGTERTLSIPSDAAYFYYYNASSYKPSKVTVQKVKPVQEYYGETKQLPADNKNNVMAVFVNGAVTFDDYSGVVSFPAGSILYYKLRESGTASGSYTFAADTSFTLTAAKKLVVRNGEVVLLSTTTDILSTDIILLTWSNNKFVSGELFPEVVRYKYDSRGRYFYTTGDVLYTKDSVTFKSGSVLYYFVGQSPTLKSVAFNEDTTFTGTSTNTTLVLREGTVSLIRYDSLRIGDVVLLRYNNNVGHFMSGELYSEYLNSIFLNTNKKFVYTVGNIAYSTNSITFGAGSGFYYKDHIAGTTSHIDFSEDTTFTASSSTVCIVLRNGQIVTSSVSSLAERDLVLLYWSPAINDFVSGVLYPEYLNKKIADTNAKVAAVDEKCSVTVGEPLYRYLKITGSGTVESATSDGNRTLVYDVSGLVGIEVKLHGVRYASSTGAYCWWTILDSNGDLVSKSETSTSSSTVKNATIVIPENSAKLYVQGSAAEKPYIILPVNKVIDTNDDTAITTRRFNLDFSYISPNTGRVAAYSANTNPANLHTTDYIKVHKTITISSLGGIKIPLNVFFYDKNLAFIKNVAYQDADNGLNTVNVDVFEQASWFRISFQLSDTAYSASPTPVYYKDNTIEISSEWDGNDVSKEPYREYTPFLYSVRANVPYKIANNPSVITKALFGYDQGLLHLPPTYTVDGAPTPVIFFIHGDGERYSTGASSFQGHMKMQQCWSDAGFAQVDLDLIPSCYVPQVGANSGGTRDDLECLQAAWEWLTNHFNVDRRGFYLIGRSRGGQGVLECLGKGGAVQLPIIAAVSMAGANSIFEYSVSGKRDRTEDMYQLWCDAHGLPTEGRPSWEDSPEYSTSSSFLTDTNIYNFVVANWDLWWRKALTGWGLISRNPENVTPKDYFDNFVYPAALNSSYTQEMKDFLYNLIDTLEMKSPVPLRMDWCVGDETQAVNPFDDTTVSYSTATYKILNKTPQSNTCIRIWDGVDPTNPYGETNPHWAENMIFYDGDLVLPNGAVTHNPSKVTMEWLIWCMGHDPRYQTTNYTLPWNS